MTSMLLKINRIQSLFFLLLLFAACTQKVHKETEAPIDLIPRDTMVSIIVDLRLMDAVVSAEQRRASRKITEINYYIHNSIINKYGISREQFKSSLSYYQQDLNVMDGIYADAITRLSKMKSMVEQE